MFRAAWVASLGSLVASVSLVTAVLLVTAVFLLTALWAPEAHAQEAPADGESAEVATTGTETIDYVPFGIAGLAVFGASWGATIVVAATTASGNKSRAAGHAVVPVGGPFIMLSESSHADGLEGVLGGLGALQGLGLAAALLGFTLESKVITDKSGAWVAPTVSQGGLGVHGAF
jgi:hypothetical protein